MSVENQDPVTSAAATVMGALQPLATEERQRVLDAAAALFGLAGPRRIPGNAGDRSEEEENVQDDRPEEQSGKGGSRKRQSIAEFLDSKSPATNPQRLACFAYYREHVEKSGQYFSKADLKPYFQSAKLPKPANYDRDFSKAVESAWIHEDGANSYLTQKGETAVAAGFNGRARPRGASASKKKKPASGKAE